MATGIFLVAAHNLLDNIHVPGPWYLLWSILHEPKMFQFEHVKLFVHYPIIPWIGLMAVGYCSGSLYEKGYEPAKRKINLLLAGSIVIGIFAILRLLNIYGDPAPWSTQQNQMFSLLSWLNVTKYPPSFLYVLITVGPALIFLSLAERPLNVLTSKIIIYGRVPFFYYVIHLFLIHFFALIGAVLTGYHWNDMILSDRINHTAALKGYGFNLGTVYIVWITVVLLLYPLCKKFASYKKNHVAEKPWLSYL